LHRPPLAVIFRSVLILAENVLAFGIEHALAYQSLHAVARLERRVQLDQRLGPQRPGRDALVHMPPGAPVADLQEALRVFGVVADEAIAQAKGIHCISPAI
jgi:hypothetical protein